LAAMKIYFGFTVAGDRSSVEMARRIVVRLEALGHEVVTRHLVEEDARERDRRLGPEEIYRRDMAWLEECELFVGEVSGSSFGIGYEAGVVLAEGTRRALLLYRKEAAGRISLLITGNTHPRCRRLAYEDWCEIEEFLDAEVGGIR